MTYIENKTMVTGLKGQEDMRECRSETNTKIPVAKIQDNQV